MTSVKREHDDCVASRRKRNRIRRNTDEIQKDVTRYYQLLDQNNDLEKDIPPRRANFKVETVLYDHKRPRTKNPVPNPVCSSKTSCLIRPKYIGAMKPIEKPKTSTKGDASTLSLVSQNRNTNNVCPPKLSLLSTQNYDHKVLLDHSYEELVKIINRNIDVKNPQNSAIDIPLHHHFIQKNLVYERERFNITDYWAESPLNFKSFSSGDIDLFFENFTGSFETAKQDSKSVPFA